MNRLALFGIVGIVVSGWVTGCTPEVFGGDGTDEPNACDGPAPGGSGWCPPAWTCIGGAWVDTAGACPDPCPTDRPWDGDACDALGAQCSYDEPMYDCGGMEETVTLECTAQGWATIGYRCMPEPICPAELPLDGTDCSGWYDAYYCDFLVETGCGSRDAFAACVSDENGNMLWDVSVYEPCDSCADNTDPNSCGANPDCRWLEPGCGEPAATAGCYPAEDCVEGSCGDGQACTTVTYDPCWNAACDACGAEALVCL